jgi:hypothetical protein
MPVIVSGAYRKRHLYPEGRVRLLGKKIKAACGKWVDPRQVTNDPQINECFACQRKVEVDG